MRQAEYTDYTLRVLMYCAAHPQRLVTIAELAERHGLSRNHLMKIVNDLARQGLLETTRGRGGGMRLLKDPAQIFMHLVGYDEKIYDAEFGKLEQQVTEIPDLKIIATDISEDAVNISKINAGIAGVEEYIEFGVCDFEETTVPEEGNGVVYFNPEYGDRLGVEAELELTYKRIGDFLNKKCKGYFGYIFTGNLELAKKIGLKPNRRIEFYTSKIDCRLFEYELYSGTKRTDK